MNLLTWTEDCCHNDITWSPRRGGAFGWDEMGQGLINKKCSEEIGIIKKTKTPGNICNNQLIHGSNRLINGNTRLMNGIHRFFRYIIG